MVNAVFNAQIELPVPVQSAQASPSPSGFGKVKDAVFEALGLSEGDLKEVGSKESENAAESGLMAAWFMAPPILETPQQGGGQEQTTNNVSKCTDPAQGILGILEGFGLLNADGTLTDQAQELLQAAYNAASATPSGEQVPSAQAAGTLPAQPETQGLTELLPVANSSPQAASHEALLPVLTPLVGNYLRSLENAQSQSDAEPVQPSNIATVLTQAAQTESTAAVSPQTEQQSGTQLEKLFSAIQAAIKPQSDTAPDSGLSKDAVTAQAEEPQKAVADTTVQNAAPQTAFAQLTDASFIKDANFSVQPNAPMADAGETVMNLVQTIEANTTEGATEFEVTLKPEHLGKLSIKLTQDSDGLKAQIKAADATVRSMLEAEMNTLQAQLKEKGVALTKIDVTYETSALNFNAPQNRRQHKSDAQESKSRLNVSGISRASAYGSASEAATVDTAAQNAARLTLQGSSVEFSA